MKYHYNWKTFLLNTAQGCGGDFPIPVRDITLYLLLCRSCTSADFHSTNLALEKEIWNLAFAKINRSTKKETKELGALLNIHIQRGSYVKASIFKLHGGFLCIHFYLPSMYCILLLGHSLFLRLVVISIETHIWLFFTAGCATSA